MPHRLYFTLPKTPLPELDAASRLVRAFAEILTTLAHEVSVGCRRVRFHDDDADDLRRTRGA
ncbi:hypothetical protein [Streptomyces sp. NPDC060035]|uniref:hypothetical protein n=1 Tax=Streptomyces sp. NPDC060035 TaxID=3347044 RepID=UPI0036C83C0E